VSPKIAIATIIYPNPEQTPTAQHIEHLFGGNTVVLCHRRHASLVGDKPSFASEEVPENIADRLAGLAARAGNIMRYRLERPLPGAKRRALEAFLRDQAVNAVLIEMGHLGPNYLRAAKNVGLPVFIYFRGYDATGYLRPSRHLSRRVASLRDVMAEADGVISVSRSLLDALQDHGISHPNSHVIPSGVDVGLFEPGEKVPGLAIAAGRFIRKKAPEITIRAFAKASEGIDGARLEMIGDGPLLEECRQLVTDLGAVARISLPGRQPHGQVRDRLKQATLFLQHSVTAPDGDQEGAPTVIQEAMVSGACVISTRHAGIPDLVEEGTHGHLVAEHDLEGFTARIRHALTHPEESAAMGRAAHLMANQEFDRHALYRKAEAVISGHVKA